MLLALAMWLTMISNTSQSISVPCQAAIQTYHHPESRTCTYPIHIQIILTLWKAKKCIFPKCQTTSCGTMLPRGSFRPYFGYFEILLWTVSSYKTKHSGGRKSGYYKNYWEHVFADTLHIQKVTLVFTKTLNSFKFTESCLIRAYGQMFQCDE